MKLLNSVSVRLAFGILLSSLVFLGARSVAAEHCYYLETEDQGDDYYMWGDSGWQCDQRFIDYWWKAFEFDKSYWDDGFGWDDCCNNAQPLARMFNALYALGYSSTGTPTCSTSSANVTLWAMCWAASQTPRTLAGCGSGTRDGTFATTHRAIYGSYIKYFWPFFYGNTVSSRASTVFHEARHASGCSHNGGTRCKRGSSCDTSWTNGCSSGTTRPGANQFQVSFLSWYIYSAWRATDALKDSARTRANYVLEYGFASDPCFRLTTRGTTYRTCR